jgi:hypothetical protein
VKLQASTAEQYLHPADTTVTVRHSSCTERILRRAVQQSALPTPWSQTAPWALVITIIIIVIGLRPDAATVGACGTLLLAAAEAHRRLTS